MNIINIISSNSHYIEIQYNNLLKNIKNEFRYIVMNNALFNSHEFQNIKLICEKLNIEHIEVKKNLEVERFTGRTLYNQNSWIDNGPTPAATYALNNSISRIKRSYLSDTQ
jgi:K+/H+ antiporter YhaU regulatory subunit KhtT